MQACGVSRKTDLQSWPRPSSIRGLPRKEKETNEHYNEDVVGGGEAHSTDWA